MANIIWAGNHNNIIDKLNLSGNEEQYYCHNDSIVICGRKKTYNIIEDGNNFLITIGSCSFPGGKLDKNLFEMLESFTESDIKKIKENCLGQYLMIIKKNDHLYFFSDFFQVRSLFYSFKEKYISSSYAAIESCIGTGAAVLNKYKLFEFLATGHIMFPSWLGNETCHNDIYRLRPFEYIKVNIIDNSFEINSMTWQINNAKIYDLEQLAIMLKSQLEKSICQENFKDSNVGATITGGFDSRLVSVIAAKYYKNIKLRIGVAKTIRRSYDFKIAKKISKILDLDLDAFHKNEENDDALFYYLTEGFSPDNNSGTTRLIDNTNLYSIGFGGLCGTQLFFPIQYTGWDEFINDKMNSIRSSFANCKKNEETFYTNILKEYTVINKHYELKENNEKDKLRLFMLHVAVSYSSFIHASFNVKGVQFEPYLSMPVFEIAFRIPEKYQGDKTTLQGTCFVQKKTMALLNKNAGKVMAYNHFTPMLPLSLSTLFPYIKGYFSHIAYWVRRKYFDRTTSNFITKFDDFEYTSDGWNRLFIRRMKEKYSPNISIEKV